MRNIILFGLASVFFSSGVVCAKTLISSGDVSVSSEELSSAIENVIPEEKHEYMRDKEKNIRGFLADYYTVKAMADAARKKGLDKDPGVQITRAYNDNRLLTEVLIKDYYASVVEPNYESLAKEAYLADPKRFSIPEQVRAEHILVSVNEEQNKAIAAKKAQQLYIQAIESKKDFAQLAKEHSDDPSAASNSGDLGFFVREAMVEPFSEAAFAMKIGEVSKPIKTEFGYHIIHVLDRKKSGLQTFDAVKSQLIDEQKRVFKNAKRDEIVSKFRSSPDIKVDEDALKDFVKKMQQ